MDSMHREPPGDCMKLFKQFALVAGIGLAFGLPAAAQGPCATCTAQFGSGNPINDACTQLIVEFQRSDAGDCRLNPGPKCVPNVNCLFSLTVEVIDHGCGAIYWNRHCTQLVNALGQPVGSEVCGGISIFPNPVIIQDYPISCGKSESFKFERSLNGFTQVIGQAKGICVACPSQAVSTDGVR